MKERGFTLIELTIVLAILVIVSGVLITRLPGWSSRQALRSSARVLGNTIRTWRERARADETPYSLEFSGGSYQVLLGNEVLRKGRLGEGEEFESDVPRSLILRARGILPKTPLTIQNRRGERITIVPGVLINEIEYQEPN